MWRHFWPKWVLDLSLLIVFSFVLHSYLTSNCRDSVSKPTEKMYSVRPYESRENIQFETHALYTAASSKYRRVSNIQTSRFKYHPSPNNSISRPLFSPSQSFLPPRPLFQSYLYKLGFAIVFYESCAFFRGLHHRPPRVRLGLAKSGDSHWGGGSTGVGGGGGGSSGGGNGGGGGKGGGGGMGYNDLGKDWQHSLVLATGSADGSIHVFDLSKGQVSKTWRR